MGDFGEKLVQLSEGGRLAYIPNALDHVPIEDQEETRNRNLTDLRKLGVSVEILNLKDFFSRRSQLESELSHFAGVWVTGGNTFVLRQAMKLSDFDQVLTDLCSTSRSCSFLYGGYSAGICVLAPDLRALQIVDDPQKFPYPEQTEVIWEGLNLLDYIILPHYKSDHPESDDIGNAIAYCKAHEIPFRPLRDGEVLFGNSIEMLRSDRR